MSLSSSFRIAAAAAVLLLYFMAPPLLAIAGNSLFVSTGGNNANPGTLELPWRTVQYACNHATAGSTIFIMSGVYNEKIAITTSGSAGGGFLTVTALDTDTVILDGTGISGDQIILIQNQQYIRIQGLELRNNLDQTFGTGIWVQGSGNHIEIINNIIHDMRAAPGGGDAMGISVYGSSTTPISNVVLRGNTIRNCQPGHSESIVLNGNVDTFLIANNVVHDVNNIGIDMIGGEKTCPDPAQDVVRNGICRGNLVYNARSIYGGGYAAGIYVDGGRNIIVERNIVHDADVGMEIGCEIKGVTASGMIVRDNLLYHNDKRGLSFGGYNYPATGRVTNSIFSNNTMFNNDILGTGEGEIYIEYTLNCTLKNNIAYAHRGRLITSTVDNSSGNIFDYNRFFTTAASGNAVDYNGAIYSTIDSYRGATGQDTHSTSGDPLFVDTSAVTLNLHLSPDSPCIEAGDNSVVVSGETDLAGILRIYNDVVDVGAYEHIPVMPAPAPPLLVGVTGAFPHYTLTWHTVTDADSFALDLSPDGLFLDSTNYVTTIDTVIVTDTLQKGTTWFWRVRSHGILGWGAWSRAWRFLSGSGNFSVQINNGWNIISLPIKDTSATTASAFPTATSPAYRFSGSYLISDSLHPGVGYWIKINGAQPVNFNGASVDSLEIAVSNGWNLIGTLGSAINTSKIEPSGATISSQYFEYQNGYQAVTQLLPGKGYWVKVEGSGFLRLH